MRVYELIRRRASSTDHVAVKSKGGSGIRLRCISSEHGSVQVDIGVVKMIEDEASISKVGEFEGAEAEELEDVELRIGVTKSDEEGLKLLEMIEVIAS